MLKRNTLECWDLVVVLSFRQGSLIFPEIVFLFVDICGEFFITINYGQCVNYYQSGHI